MPCHFRIATLGTLPFTPLKIASSTISRSEIETGRLDVRLGQKQVTDDTTSTGTDTIIRDRVNGIRVGLDVFLGVIVIGCCLVL